MSDLEITDPYGDTLRFRDRREHPSGHVTAFLHPASADRAALRVGVVLDDDDLIRLRDWLTEALDQPLPNCGRTEPHGAHDWYGFAPVRGEAPRKCPGAPGCRGVQPADRPYTDAELARGQDDTRDRTLTLALLADRVTALEAYVGALVDTVNDRVAALEQRLGRADEYAAERLEREG